MEPAARAVVTSDTCVARMQMNVVNYSRLIVSRSTYCSVSSHVKNSETLRRWIRRVAGVNPDVSFSCASNAINSLSFLISKSGAALGNTTSLNQCVKAAAELFLQRPNTREHWQFGRCILMKRALSLIVPPLQEMLCLCCQWSKCITALRYTWIK